MMRSRSCVAWNPSNDVCGLRYALGGVIHAQ